MSDRGFPPVPERDLKNLSLDTRAVSARPRKHIGKETTPLVPPICHASTYRIEKIDDFLDVITEGGQIYSRLGNFTTEAVECAINALEEGAGSLVFGSGMAAISTVFICHLNSGDHVIYQNPMYSNTVTLLYDFKEKYGIELTAIPAGCNVEEYQKNVKPNTKMFIGETPCNPSMTILNLEEFGKLGQKLGILTMVDSTFGSCYLQQPIKHGVDLSVHSCTKYIGGHSDLIAGCVTTRTVEQWKKLKKWQTNLGGILSPHDASLLLRGVKTLPVRMERHSLNAMKIAEYLEKHPKVESVFYPGLPSHPHHEIAKKQMKSFGGMIRCDVKGGEQEAKTVAESLKLIQLAVSLGGVESIIEQPYLMTHGRYLFTEEEQRESNILPNALRLSIGLEDADDIIQDFNQALEKITV
ncbi:L-methionine gamma-lyase isoform X1 [Patella vulgata]|uniref:L-methionine gamma-lyase isoform X1 n=2 Tax=Patella vulgata TaxID=6465 RepID=UPI00217F98B1|nr:L-methionine gamma-lyase isoform X1 [Patella vulgata]